MLGIRLAISPPIIHQGWVGDALPSTTITDAWVGAGKVFGELWIQDAVVEEVDTVIEDFDKRIEQQEEFTQPMITPKKTLRFTVERSILKEPSVSKRKPISFTQPYFRCIKHTFSYPFPSSSKM